MRLIRGVVQTILDDWIMRWCVILGGAAFLLGVMLFLLGVAGRGFGWW